MKRGIYAAIGLDNLRKHRRFYLPRIFTEIGLVGCLYIFYTLTIDKKLTEIKGGDYIPTCMMIGTTVLSILSVILMLYSNRFLMKQRKGEFGLYHVLGMEKRHVRRVLICESFSSSLISILAGLLFGVLFYKLCTLFICRLMIADAVQGFSFISFRSLIPTALFFLTIDALTYGINCIEISRMKPVDLLQSIHTGERAPKVKWLLLVIGMLSLGTGYGIALSVKQPTRAIMLFLPAVLAVVIGTYFLFVSGSIFILRLLKRKRSYYYHPKHMPAVSGLLYRMKQNAVGLASISILSTGVLIMISSAFSLYAGTEQTIAKYYPDDLYLSCTVYNGKPVVSSASLGEIVQTAAKKHGVAIDSIREQRFLSTVYAIDSGVLADRAVLGDINDFSRTVELTVMTAEQYEKLGMKHLSLSSGEAALYVQSEENGQLVKVGDTLSLNRMTISVTSAINDFPLVSTTASTLNCYGLVLADESDFLRYRDEQKALLGEESEDITDRIAVRFVSEKQAGKRGKELEEDIIAALDTRLAEENREGAGYGYTLDTVWDMKQNVYGMYGSLLFLGLLLGLVFLFATTLIIYYKQISEGYEDRRRFQIMQQIGMSSTEVKKTIRSQIMLVFFLPLFVCALHTLVAFPILAKLLHLLLLSSTLFFGLCTIGVFAVFTLIYFLIYGMTARTYYKIVH